MPEAVSTHHRIVLQCIEDKDLSIRTQSLQLVSGIVNGQSLYEIVKKLMVHLSHENEALDVYSAEIVEYRTFVARVIISCCTNDSYKNLGDFEWFIDVLTDLWKFHGMTVGKLVSEELINVCVRVSQVREYALTKCRELLSNVNVQKASSDGASVLAAASWITGEYTADEKIEIHLLESLLSPEILQLNSEIQLFFLYAFLKLLLRFRQQHFNLNLNIFSNLLGCFVNSSSLEVQERVFYHLQGIFSAGPGVGSQCSR